MHTAWILHPARRTLTALPTAPPLAPTARDERSGQAGRAQQDQGGGDGGLGGLLQGLDLALLYRLVLPERRAATLSRPNRRQSCARACSWPSTSRTPSRAGRAWAARATRHTAGSWRQMRQVRRRRSAQCHPSFDGRRSLRVCVCAGTRRRAAGGAHARVPGVVPPALHAAGEFSVRGHRACRTGCRCCCRVYTCVLVPNTHMCRCSSRRCSWAVEAPPLPACSSAW